MAALKRAAAAAAPRRSRASVAMLLAVTMAIMHLTAPAFSLTSGMNRKQAKSTQNTRGNLKPQVLEIPLEEPELEPEEKEPLPEKRIPYTLHMVTQFPNHKHLGEESSAKKYLEAKLVGALDHMDDMIKHVELRLNVEENFHRTKDGHKKVVDQGLKTVLMEDDSVVEVPAEAGKNGAKVLAPYQIKVVVSLKNNKEVVFSNPEKHAQNTLTEAADGMADGLRRLLREEKNKEISHRRHAKETMGEGDRFEDELTDDIGEAEDAAVEAMYKEIEDMGEEK